MPMIKTFTLLKSVDELEAFYWLELFENLPEELFTTLNTEPSQLVINNLRQFARSFTVLKNSLLVLN